MNNICAGGISDDGKGEYRSRIGAKWTMIKQQEYTSAFERRQRSASSSCRKEVCVESRSGLTWTE